MQFIYPVKIPPGSLGQPFAGHWLDYSQFGLIGHNGQDFPAPLGTPIYAVADGYIVEQTAKETGFGLRITQRINDGDKHYLVVYGHMQRLENPVDIPWNWFDTSHPVKQGDVIGYVNSTGFSTGNHLHLGLYEQLEDGTRLNINNGYGGAIDPMPFIKGQDMEFYQVQGESTVVKKEGGKYFEIATDPVFYPYIKALLGIPDTLNPIGRDVVNANLGGQLVVGITYVKK